MPEVRISRTRRGPNTIASFWKGDPAEMIMKALQETATYDEAAKRLGISQSTLYRYIHRYDIKPIWDETNQELIFDY